MRTAELLVVSKQNPHARPADLFVHMANKFSGDIQIRKPFY
ncbi:MAG: HPr family phosphocarrier protein [Pelolinea sp.]|nr:HPr family phosphocarrier protein [Pelolinea sp.]